MARLLIMLMHYDTSTMFDICYIDLAYVLNIGLIGPVVVSKMPCVHPGDVRKLKAVNVKQLSHMKDVIVFPQKVRILNYIPLDS